MDFTKLKFKEAKIKDYSIRLEYWILDDLGKNTLRNHIIQIGPETDVTWLELPEYEIGLIQTARTGYLKQE